MSNLEPRRRSAPSRKQREGRAYKLVLATSGLLILTIVLVILAIAGVVGGGVAFVAALLTAGSGWMLRRTIGS
jgi:hypothetical protein